MLARLAAGLRVHWTGIAMRVRFGWRRTLIGLLLVSLLAGGYEVRRIYRL
jgi:hypothetical protein